MDPIQHVQQPNQTNLRASKIRNQQAHENHQYQPRAQRQVEIAGMHKLPAGELGRPHFEMVNRLLIQQSSSPPIKPKAAIPCLPSQPLAIDRPSASPPKVGNHLRSFPLIDRRQH